MPEFRGALRVSINCRGFRAAAARHEKRGYLVPFILLDHRIARSAAMAPGGKAAMAKLAKAVRVAKKDRGGNRYTLTACDSRGVVGF